MDNEDNELITKLFKVVSNVLTVAAVVAVILAFYFLVVK